MTRTVVIGSASRVASAGSAGRVGHSLDIGTRRPLVPLVPGPISDLVATDLSPTDVELFYTPASGATSHEYRIDGGSWIAFTIAGLVEGLTPETEYAFEVRGVNANGNGPASNVSIATTQS